MSEYQPPSSILPLPESLALLDRVFGANTILNDRGKDQVRAYYKQSLIGYEKYYHARGAMHMALNDGSEPGLGGFQKQVKRFRDLMSGEKMENILELGSGAGFNLVWMAKNFPDAKVTGIDLLPDHIGRTRKRAKKNGLTNLEAREGDFAAIPEDLGQFDLIYSVEALCHAPELPNLFKQIAARLRPGGRFMVFDSFRNFQPGELSEDYARAMEIAEITVAVNSGFHTVPAWMDAVKGAGLELVADEDYSHQVLPTLVMLHERCIGIEGGFKRVLMKTLPRYLARNGAAGLMGFHAHAPIPGRADGQGPLSYRCIAARKPE